jgi:hypothetical protein
MMTGKALVSFEFQSALIAATALALPRAAR